MCRVVLYMYADCAHFHTFFSGLMFSPFFMSCINRLVMVRRNFFLNITVYFNYFVTQDMRGARS